MLQWMLQDAYKAADVVIDQAEQDLFAGMHTAWAVICEVTAAGCYA